MVPANRVAPANGEQPTANPPTQPQRKADPVVDYLLGDG